MSFSKTSLRSSSILELFTRQFNGSLAGCCGILGAFSQVLIDWLPGHQLSIEINNRLTKPRRETATKHSGHINERKELNFDEIPPPLPFPSCPSTSFSSIQMLVDVVCAWRLHHCSCNWMLDGRLHFDPQIWKDGGGKGEGGRDVWASWNSLTSFMTPSTCLKLLNVFQRRFFFNTWSCSWNSSRCLGCSAGF